ncbi:MAG: hypothetical protein NC225_06710 [Clostridium sp.]|nr:hypothetical protein [Clostridium sp.]MCM1459181.1 hypothetical protein [Bacteroides sp.]
MIKMQYAVVKRTYEKYVCDVFICLVKHEVDKYMRDTGVTAKKNEFSEPCC